MSEKCVNKSGSTNGNTRMNRIIGIWFETLSYTFSVSVCCWNIFSEASVMQPILQCRNNVNVMTESDLKWTN